RLPSSRGGARPGGRGARHAGARHACREDVATDPRAARLSAGGANRSAARRVRGLTAQLVPVPSAASGARAAHAAGRVVPKSYRLQPLIEPSSVTASTNAFSSSTVILFAT